jgi:hypothetical protein
MRRNLSKVLQVLAVTSGIAVTVFTGCSSTGSYKMPGMDMFSWGKKKPADSSLAASSRSNLPAPPSSTSRPQPVPSYTPTQPSGASPAQMASNPATSPGSFGQAGRLPHANTGQTGSTSTSQGFYSPEYAPQSAPSSSYGGNAVPSNPYAQTGAPSSGTPWNSNPASQYAPPNAGYPSSTPQSPYATPSGSGQYGPGPGAGTAPAGASPMNQIHPSGGYGNLNSGGTTYPTPSAGQAYSAPSVGGQPTQEDVANKPWRPGSTGRETPYGSSDGLRVAEAPGIQPASFSGANSQYPASQPAGQQPPGNSAPAASPYGSNSGYPSIYGQ